MVKQKNHTARNNTVKAHRNGIKKPKIHRFTSTRGVSFDLGLLRDTRCISSHRLFINWLTCVLFLSADYIQLDPKFLRNQHWAKKFDKKRRNRKNKNKACAVRTLFIDEPL